MDRYKLRVRRCRGTGFSYKRDTPMKAAQRKRGGYRILLPRKRYYTLPEEPEEENMHDSSVKPASSESETPIFQDFQDGDTPQSVTSCSTEPDTTLSSEEEDEDYDSSNCFSGGSATLSSLPSPEIFRKENVKSMNSSDKELSLYLQNKNSTLLDVSHAKSIQMQQPPNISAIIDTSTILIEKNCVTSHYKNPEPDGVIQTDSFKSDLQSKTPPELIVRKPILYKKKVSFKSPTIAETFEAKPIPSSTSKLSNIPEQVKPDADPSTMGEIDFKEEALPLTVKLKRPVKTSPVKAKFFDFGSDSVKDAYFQWMRERCDKLKNPVLFPFMLGTQEPSVL